MIIDSSDANKSVASTGFLPVLYPCGDPPPSLELSAKGTVVSDGHMAKRGGSPSEVIADSRSVLEPHVQREERGRPRALAPGRRNQRAIESITYSEWRPGDWVESKRGGKQKIRRDEGSRGATPPPEGQKENRPCLDFSTRRETGVCQGEDVRLWAGIRNKGCDFLGSSPKVWCSCGGLSV